MAPQFFYCHLVRGQVVRAEGHGRPKNEAINRVAGVADDGAPGWKYRKGERRGLLPIPGLSRRLRCPAGRGPAADPRRSDNPATV
jgi:hypothetical protein